MSEAKNPRVFLSHASEDKGRFVLDFATRLRARGIDVWLDWWEMYPGDSLVDKIFEEGLKDAAAVVVVLSANSIDKKWVREELNASVVARISKGTRLIPVVLDDVAVPEALKSTVWVGIRDLSSYEKELDRIVASIFDVRPKPPLGEPPPYTQTNFTISGLSAQDAQVLKLFCDGAMKKDGLLVVNTNETAKLAEQEGIAGEQFLESATVLVEHGYLKPAEILAPTPPYYTVTTRGFDTYVHTQVPGYDAFVGAVVSEIVNKQNLYNQDIMQALGRSDYLLVDHILEVLNMKGLVSVSKCIGHHTYVQKVSPRLKRLLESGG
jgi:hypothetical protein